MPIPRNPMTQRLWLTGLIPAAFTPLKADGSLNLDAVPALVEHFLRDGVSGLYVCGSTGEGVSLTREERMAVAEAYTAAAARRIPVVVQVGHNSLREARLLAEHAQKIGADAVSATPPMYFKPANTEAVVACMAEVAAGAPDLAFYYYHIPPMTGVNVDMAALNTLGRERIPTWAGVKFSSTSVYDMVAALNAPGAFNFVFGSDEMLLSGLVAGAHGAVGSTYNFAAPLFNKVIAAFQAGDIVAAQRHQLRATTMILTILRHGALPALKAVMSLIGYDCGPTRLPHLPLTSAQVAALRADLDASGFFDWATN